MRNQFFCSVYNSWDYDERLEKVGIDGCSPVLPLKLLFCFSDYLSRG